jgi:phospholipid/cholesterol/gamma-HCH transport system substrate-binding protein
MSRTFRLGVFIVAGLAVLACGVFLIGSKKSLFEKTYRIKAEFQNVAGLNEGSDVRVGGVHRGTVKHIQLPARPDQKIVVAMDLNANTRAVVRKDSVASIKSEGLMGDQYVEISFGSVQAATLTDGDTIGSQPPVNISDLINKSGVILDQATEAVKDIRGTAGNLNEITGTINQGKGTAGKFINNSAVYDKMNAAATDLQEDMEALKHNFLTRGYFKKRGYEDTDELRTHQVATLPRTPSERTFHYDAAQLFNRPDAAKLKKAKELDEVGDYLQQNKFGLAVVVVRAGMKGDTEKQRVLTEARAVVIRDYLVSHFELDDTRLKTMGEGKTHEGGDNGDVQILVYPVAVAKNTGEMER